MAEGWQLVFRGDIDGRSVYLKRYDPTGELCVETTQLETEVTEGYVDGNSKVFPSVISKGSRIDIEGATPEELERELRKCGFTAEGAGVLARIARSAGVA